MRPAQLPYPRRTHWFHVAVRLALIVLLGQLLLALPTSAATSTLTVAIPSFNATNIQGFQLNRSATLSGSVIKLTPAIPDQAGSAFWENRVSLANQRSFSAYFVMDMPGPGGFGTGGADGIVFTIQTQSNTAGGAGGGIGYSGITPSVGIEFDTWENTEVEVGDPNDNHVGLDINGSLASEVTASPPGILEGNTWHVWVDYQGSSNQLQVRMHPTNDRNNSTLVLNTTRNLAAVIGQDVFIGFTAGTGGAYANHDIQAFYFVNDYAPIDTNATPPNIYNQAPAQVAVTASPASIATGGSSTITATVRDVSGAAMANQPVTFSTSLGALVTSSGVTNASGQVSVVLNGGASAGTATIRATAAGGVFGTATVTVSGPTLYKVYIPTQIGIPVPTVITSAP